MRDENADPLQVPILMAGEERFEGCATREVIDAARYEEKSGRRVVVAECAMAGAEDIDRAVAVAREAPDGWRRKTLDKRHRILDRAAHEIRRARGDLIGAAAANWGKVFTESDPEVSEAIDFVELYAHTAHIYEDAPNLQCRPRGVGLVLTPWNFPIAIPCGGISASLAAGNTVLFKPASAAVLTAWELVRCFHRAGVSKNALQFVPCSGEEAGSRLTGHRDVDYIILTGGTETGLRIFSGRPDVQLAAETGGKNATVVTAMSDRDQAVKNIIHSAYSNSGQKCSATSLLVLEREVYEDGEFRRQLVDAAKSCRTGSAWQFENRLGCLVYPPRGDLRRALTTTCGARTTVSAICRREGWRSGRRS